MSLAATDRRRRLVLGEAIVLDVLDDDAGGVSGVISRGADILVSRRGQIGGWLRGLRRVTNQFDVRRGIGRCPACTAIQTHLRPDIEETVDARSAIGLGIDGGAAFRTPGGALPNHYSLTAGEELHVQCKHLGIVALCARS